MGKKFAPRQPGQPATGGSTFALPTVARLTRMARLALGCAGLIVVALVGFLVPGVGAPAADKKANAEKAGDKTGNVRTAPPPVMRRMTPPPGSSGAPAPQGNTKGGDESEPGGGERAPGAPQPKQ